MYKLLIPLFVLFAFSSLAQPGVADVVVVDGKRYYEHKVQSGNTLWGMQGMYGVPYQEIIEANPGFDGLKEGETVLVPVKGEETAVVETSNYKVKNRETLYGLSRKFNTTVDKLIELNPELATEGLKKGQVIKVPGKVEDDTPVVETPVVTTPNPFVVDTVETVDEGNNVVVSFSDTTVRHTVMEHETMYKISKRYMVAIEEIMKINDLHSTTVRPGQVLIIPVKNERVETVPIKSVSEGYDPESSDPIVFDVKDKYSIALMLPLHLEYGAGYSEYMSGLATQFYMGAMLAVDTLERKGLKADVHVFDTRNDTNVVAALLQKPEFQNMDMIIGPLLGSNMSQVATFCKENKVRMVCPVSIDSKLLENNRLVYASVPSNITMMQGLARHMLANNKGDKIILVKPLDKESLPLYDAFRKAFTESDVEGARPSLVETTVEGFNLHMTRNADNCFVVPTVNKRTASKFMTNVNKSNFRARKDGIYVYGTREWAKFNDINNAFKNKYNLHFPAPTYMDYYTDEMIELNKVFRSRYKTDMSKVAVQAYDVLLHYASDFFLQDDDSFNMMNDFQSKQVSEMDGYENTNVFIIEQEEYELIQVAKTLAR